MHGICFDFPLQDWFDFKIPRTKVPPNFIQKAIQVETGSVMKPNAKMVWLGNEPELVKMESNKKGKKTETWGLVFEHKQGTYTIAVSEKEGAWLEGTIKEMTPKLGKKEMTFSDFEQRYITADLGDFDRFLGSKVWRSLLEFGLVLV
jgi:hypothetical protein